MTPDSVSPGPDVPAPSGADPELAGRVAELITTLQRTVRTRQTYVQGNPLIERFQRNLRGALEELWPDLPHVTLDVDETRMTWRDAEVYAHPLGHDNLAFVLHRDGIRRLAFLPGCEEAELEQFVAVLSDLRPGRPVDVLAELWHRDFECIRMEYVDVAEEETLDLPGPEHGTGTPSDSDRIEDMSEIREALGSAAPTGEEDEDEFAGFRLGEADEAYLRRAMEAEWSRPLVRDVVLALLDQFEMRDEERRRQVVDIVRQLLPRLLGERDFAHVALLVTELQLLANKTGDRETQELVTSLLRDMSEAMAELVSASGTVSETPDDGQLEALLGALQPEAIPTLVRAIPSVPDVPLRERLSEALDRLVAARPERIVSLLDSEDPMLAAEAARIVGRLGVSSAGPVLERLLSRPEQVARRAAVTALAALGTGGDPGALLSALDDEERDVRMAALDALARLQPEGTGEALAGRLDPRRLESMEPVERVALLRAAGALAPRAVVARLARILTGRKWWGGRWSPALRASAARALGLLDSDEARETLRRAADDREPAVQSAVRAALRETVDTGDER